MKIFQAGFIVKFVILIFAVSACATTPTGRRQMRLMGEGQMDQMGDSSFSEMQKKLPVSTNPQYNAMVRCISIALLKAMGTNPNEWDIKVFDDKSPNAFALPGNNIGVHTGMITLVQNQHQLAAVIGHEIGHVLAHHGNERVSQSMISQTGMQVAGAVLGNGSQSDQLILAGLGLGAQFGVLLPFSRKQETEADRMGVEYMAKAGFDPTQAAALWQVMSAASGGGGQPEFMSTHPSAASRIADLTAYAKGYVATYQNAPIKPQCK